MVAARDPLREAAIKAASREYPNPPGIEHTSVRMDVEAKRVAYVLGYMEATRRASARAVRICEEVEADARDQYKGRGKYAPDNPYRADTYMDGVSSGAGQCADLIAAAAPEEKEG